MFARIITKAILICLTFLAPISAHTIDPESVSLVLNHVSDVSDWDENARVELTASVKHEVKLVVNSESLLTGEEYVFYLDSQKSESLKPIIRSCMHLAEVASWIRNRDKYDFVLRIIGTIQINKSKKSVDIILDGSAKEPLSCVLNKKNFSSDI